MTTSTPLINHRLGDRRGFTLTELIIAASLSSVILAGVLSTFLMMGRTGANTANYAKLEAEARNALEYFGRDVRMANNVSWGSLPPSTATSLTLTIPPSSAGGPTRTVIYAWDSASKRFIRRDSTTGTFVLIANCTVFSFQAYKLGGTGEASNALETKQIQLSLTASRSSTTVVTATDVVLSARFILRNKDVSA